MGGVMSYERRTATKRTPAMQAALDKRAAMMLRVHEARIEGALSDADVNAVESSNQLIQSMLTLVAAHKHTPDNEGVNRRNTDNPHSGSLDSVLSNLPVSPEEEYRTTHVVADGDNLVTWLQPREFYINHINPSQEEQLHHHLWANCLKYQKANILNSKELLANLNNYIELILTSPTESVNVLENVDIVPKPLSISTVPTNYYLTNKQGR